MPSALLGAGDDDDRYDPLTIQQEVTPAEIVIALSIFIFFCKFFASINISFFLGRNRFPGISLSILTLRLWENLSRPTTSSMTKPVSVATAS